MIHYWKYGEVVVTYRDINTIPKEGDVTKGSIIGRKCGLYMWVVCKSCGNGRWVAHNHLKIPKWCWKCSTHKRTYSETYIEKRRLMCVVRNTTMPNPIKGKKLPPRSEEHARHISEALKKIEHPKRAVRGILAKGSIESPLLGDIRYGDELQDILENYYNDSQRYIYVQCPFCKRYRWSDIKSHKDSLKRGHNDRCKYCRARENSILWKNGSYISRGYRHILIFPEDKYFPMARKYNKLRTTGYILEHRYVMAKYMGRCLDEWELVHHKNHNKLDNRIENLELIKPLSHIGLTAIEMRVEYLENKLKKLEESGKVNDQLIKLLLWHIKQIYISRDSEVIKC